MTNRSQAVIEDFLSRLTILDYTHKVAAHFGNIKTRLAKRGKIIGKNDIHIAAHALR